MSTFKKLLALTLALAMVLSVSAFAGYKADTYKDAAGIDEDCEDAIELMYALEIMKGDTNGNFNPTATITRAEIAKMIYVILNYGEDDKAVNYTGAKMFSDVPAGAWFEGYVNYCGTTKLVQGRGNGTFGPNDPVTCAEAAKMLLTAIGYSAADRGYTGANWDKNVLSDAAILGLLDGYKYNTNTYAPRQWVAVLFQNAMDCLTYKTMRPVISGGLLTSININEKDYDTMGQKYFGYDDVTGYLVAANGYYIDGEAADFNFKKYDLYIQKGSNLYGFEGDVTVEDLGQQFRVIAIDDEVISMRNTGKSVVAEDEVKDITWELTYGTNNNDKNNKYEFTVDELTAKLNGGEANVLDIVKGNSSYTVEDASDVKAEITKAGVRNDVVRAIDKDGDGDIDYVVYTPVEYAVITKVATSQKYGDYIKADDVNGKALTFEGGANLYIDDVIITEDELEVDNFVKFTWNIDEGKYNVEVLPVEEAAEFESRKVTKNEYTFEGETYGIADNAFPIKEKLNGKNVLGEDFDIVIDGDLLVYATETDDNYANIDEVNEHLALLIKHNIGNLDRENVEQVKLMTIDGDIEWYWYDATTAAKKDSLVDFKELDNDTLYIFHEDEDGWVTLEAIETEQAGKGNLKTKLVDTFDVYAKGANTDERGTLDNTGSRTLYKTEQKDFRVAPNNKFFAKVDGEYKVITMDDLAEGEYLKVEAQAMVKNSTYYTTIVGGYLDIDEAVVSGIGYLWVVDGNVKDVDDSTQLISVMFPDAEEPVEIEVVKGEYVDNWAYAYAQSDEIYTLTPFSGWAKIVEEDGELWNAEGKNVELDHDLYLLTITTNYRIQSDENVTEKTVLTTEFVDADAILAAFDDMDTDTYDYTVTYTTDKNADNTTVFYLSVVRDMIEAQDEGFEPEV